MNDLSAERSLRNGPHETVHGSSDGPTMAPRSFPSADEQDLDLAKLFGLLWRRKWVILLSSLVFASLAAYWAYSQTPFFTASTSVYYSQSRNQVVDIESVVTSGPVTTTFLTSELKIIRSQQLLNRVVEEYGLDQDPEFNYALRPPQTSMIGSVIGWARETASSIISPSDALKTIRGQQDLPPDLPGAEGQEIGTLSRERLRIISTFQRAVTVRIEDRSFVIRISVKTQNPTKSARLANAVARHYIVDQLEAKYQATARASDWLSERVVDLRERVETAETKVEHFRSETGIASEDASSELVLEVSALESRLEAAQGDLDRAQGDLATLRRVMDEGDFASALPLINRPSAVDTLRAFQAAAETGSTDAKLEQRARLTIAERILGLEGEERTAASRFELIERSLAESSVKAEEQARSLVKLRQLQREAESTRLIYETFLARAKETSEQKGLEEADARILEEAQVPSKPSHPRRQVIIAVGALTGIIGALAVIFALEFFRRSFRSSDEVEAELGLPVLSQIPISKNSRSRADVVTQFLSEPTSALSESVRFLRTAVSLSHVDHRDSALAVMFTSAVPAEGKSTTGVMTALANAKLGLRTIIIDCDLRRPSLHRALSVENSASIVGVISGELALHETVIEDRETGLHILPGSRAVVNAADLLSSQSFRSLMEQLREDYDMIVIDAPPALAVPDAAIIGTLIDTAVIVTQWNKTPKDAVKNAIRLLWDKGIHVGGVVLSQVDPRKQARYSYGYSSYGYVYKQNTKYYTG